MTTSECSKVLKVLAAAWPNQPMSRETSQVYARMLSDLEYTVAAAAVERLIATQRGAWLPTVGEIRGVAAELALPAPLDPDEAWGEITSAIRRYGWPQEAAALASLSPLVRRVAHNIGWTELCASDRPDVIRGQFRAMYQAAVERQLVEQTLPAELQRGALAATGCNTAVEVGTKHESALRLREIIDHAKGGDDGGGGADVRKHDAGTEVAG